MILYDKKNNCLPSTQYITTLNEEDVVFFRRVQRISRQLIKKKTTTHAAGEKSLARRYA